MELAQPTARLTGGPVTPSSETGKAVISSDFETFLKMLTVQMQNQDPLNPTDPSDYALQLATFSGVEQAVLTNQLLTSLMSQMSATGMAQMADWVGKEARAAIPAHFDGSPITIAPNPSAIASRVELVVTDEQGNEVQRIDIPKSTEPVEWAGVGTNGAPLPSGTYVFSVVSHANGEIVLNEVADVYARVNEVRTEGGETFLILKGGIPVLAAQVSALREG